MWSLLSKKTQRPDSQDLWNICLAVKRLRESLKSSRVFKNVMRHVEKALNQIVEVSETRQPSLRFAIQKHALVYVVPCQTWPNCFTRNNAGGPQHTVRTEPLKCTFIWKTITFAGATRWSSVYWGNPFRWFRWSLHGCWLIGLSTWGGLELCTWPGLFTTHTALVILLASRKSSESQWYCGTVELRPNLTKLLTKFIVQQQPDFRYTTMSLAAFCCFSLNMFELPTAWCSICICLEGCREQVLVDASSWRNKAIKQELCDQDACSPDLKRVVIMFDFSPLCTAGWQQSWTQLHHRAIVLEIHMVKGKNWKNHLSE